MQQAVVSSQSRPLAAAGWMSGALASFSMMAIAGREVSADLDTFELMMWRSLVGWLVIVAVLCATGKLSHIRLRHPKLHITRNICHFTGQNLWFLAVTMIPLAQVFAYEFTTPIWVTLLAALLLGERLTKWRAFSVLLGFSGILIVAQPWSSTASFGTGQIAVLAAALGFAGTYIFTKKLARTENTASILFFMTASQFLMGLICAGIDGDIAVPQGNAFVLTVIVAFCGLCAHFCITTALGLAPASIVSPMDFLRLPLIAILGMLIYAEPLDPFVFMGAIVVFSANLININAERKSAA